MKVLIVALACVAVASAANTRDLLQANSFANGAAAFVPGFAQAAGASGVSVVGPGSAIGTVNSGASAQGSFVNTLAATNVPGPAPVPVPVPTPPQPTPAPAKAVTIAVAAPAKKKIPECEKKVLEVCCALPVGVDKKGKPAPPTVCKFSEPTTVVVVDKKSKTPTLTTVVEEKTYKLVDYPPLTWASEDKDVCVCPVPATPTKAAKVVPVVVVKPSPSPIPVPVPVPVPATAAATANAAAQATGTGTAAADANAAAAAGGK
ncbi:hypothetical protein N2152v2_011266 [Parachlorella kessleri]